MLYLMVAVALATAAPNANVQNTCPPRLVSAINPFYMQVFNGTCFHFVVNDRKMYRDASIACRKDGGTLAMPKTETLNRYLSNQSLHYYGVVDELWIGLRDHEDDSTFIWADQEQMVWHHLANYQDHDNDWFGKLIEDCVALDPLDGFWYDSPCNNQLWSAALGSDLQKMYICQYSS
ncbi:hypothetical protein RRG08_034856 [Elysia crispata]|uniref:C-type lectin domain-containing protein n=1 Tax=Elysia crispata TaxID=231223 RepID=A0AAE1AND4_9GAST|nr:hypothetical protein RRG08_034856 [Elysia crispata]